MAKLIKETTKSERENYLNKLFACKNGSVKIVEFVRFLQVLHRRKFIMII